MAKGSQDPRTQDDHLQSERQVLFELLEHFPAQLRVDDLTMRISRFEAEPTFADGEQVKASVAELVGFGLAFRHDRLVVPTVAALHFDLLLEGY